MSRPDLPIPAGLAALIADGRWPRDAEAFNAQVRRPLVAKELVRRFAPEQDEICLYPPPFGTISDDLDRPPTVINGVPIVNDFLQKFFALDQIDPALSLVIADFGMGADAEVILDYRGSPANPCVRRLKWADRGRGNAWVKCADDFDEFAVMLGLLPPPLSSKWPRVEP